MKRTTLEILPYDASLQKLAYSFNCGNDYLNRFLRSASSLDVNRGKTYVCVTECRDVIVGYFNIGVGHIDMISTHGNIRIGGSAHINCFALDNRFRGTIQATTEDGSNIYLSDILLQMCLAIIRRIRETMIGFAFVTLCSTEDGHKLYLRNDFEDLDDDLDFSYSDEETDGPCYRMYLPLDFE